MKKTYFAPKSEICAIDSHNLMNAVSLTANGSDNVGIILGGEGASETYGGEFSTKDWFVWDFED